MKNNGCETKCMKKNSFYFGGVTTKYKNISMMHLVIETLMVKKLAEYNFPGIRRNFAFDHEGVLLSVNQILRYEYILQ